MDFALFAGRLVLAAVFGIAGLTKLADRQGSRLALVGFGVPVRWARQLGVALPLAEFAVAVALISAGTARWGAFGALMLLLVFVAGIGVSLARGKRPDCHCFGQLHSAPVGWPTLARNVALAAIAAFILQQGWNDPGPSAMHWTRYFSTGERIAMAAAVIGLVGLAVEGWLLFHLIRQNGRLLLRLGALEDRIEAGGARPSPIRQHVVGHPLGSIAPAFSLPGLYGELITLDGLRAAGKPVLLVFTDPNCDPCITLLPEVGQWQHQHAIVLTIAAISLGTVESNRAKTAQHVVGHVLLQRDQEVAQAYRAHGTPSAVLVRPDGTVGSPLAAGAEAIRDLVTQAVRSAGRPLVLMSHTDGHREHGGLQDRRLAPPAGAKVGEPAPDLNLPDLSGRTVTLADFRGEPTLVLFWDPGCSFCRRGLDDLKVWEAHRQEGAPTLLVVSTGDLESNRKMELRSTVVRDTGFAVGRAFGATGTPSAVLIDADGTVASGVAVGMTALWALAGGAAGTPLKIHLA